MKPLLLFLLMLTLSSCGGGGRRFLLRVHRDDRQHLQSFIQRERAQRAAAGQQLQGRALRTEYSRIETASAARIDSLLKLRYRTRPFHRHRLAIERELGFEPSGDPTPAPAALEALERF